MFLGPFAPTPVPLCLIQHLLSRIATYLPLGRHPDKFYPHGLLCFQFCFRHQKLPSLQPSSYYLLQDYGLADISYNSGTLTSLEKILGRPVPSKPKTYLRMVPTQSQTFFQKAFIGLLLLFQGHE